MKKEIGFCENTGHTETVPLHTRGRRKWCSFVSKDSMV